MGHSAHGQQPCPLGQRQNERVRQRAFPLAAGDLLDAHAALRAGHPCGPVGDPHRDIPQRHMAPPAGRQTVPARVAVATAGTLPMPAADQLKVYGQTLQVTSDACDKMILDSQSPLYYLFHRHDRPLGHSGYCVLPQELRISLMPFKYLPQAHPAQLVKKTRFMKVCAPRPRATHSQRKPCRRICKCAGHWRRLA
jgi:hypothetical protein